LPTCFFRCCFCDVLIIEIQANSLSLFFLSSERITGNGQQFRRNARQEDRILVDRQQSGRAEAKVPTGIGAQEGVARSAADRRESPRPGQHRQEICTQTLRDEQLRKTRHEERSRLACGVQIRVDRGSSGVTGRSDDQSKSSLAISFLHFPIPGRALARSSFDFNVM